MDYRSTLLSLIAAAAMAAPAASQSDIEAAFATLADRMKSQGLPGAFADDSAQGDAGTAPENAPANVEQVGDLRVETLGEVRTPSLRLGTSGKYAYPFARTGAYYTQETRPGQAPRVAEGLSMEVELGADGRFDGWRGELAAVEMTNGGYNAQWDGDFFMPIAIASSGIDLRLGGMTLIDLSAEKELAWGEVIEKRLFDRRKKYKIGPARVKVRTKMYAAFGGKVGGTVFLSAPGEPVGSDLGLGAALELRATAAARASVRSGRKKFRVSGYARFALLDVLNQYTLGARQSGLDAQMRLRFEALSMKIRVKVKAWFYKARRTLLNWRMAAFEVVAGT